MREPSRAATGVTSSHRIEYMPLRDIARWNLNPKSHDIGMIHDSIRRFGFKSPLLVNETTMHLVAGHGRLDTLQRMWEDEEEPPDGIKIGSSGEWLVPVVRGLYFANDREAAAFAVADNRGVELGGWNEPMLADVLKELAENDALYAIGYDADDLDDMLKNLDTGEEEGEQSHDEEKQRAERDAIGNELAIKWGTAEGQVWAIRSRSLPGRAHRLCVGDSTDPATWQALLGEDRADLLVTSPPYGVGKEYEEGGYEQWLSLVTAVFATSASYVSLAAVNLADVKVGPQSRELHTYGSLVSVMESSGLPLIGTRIWTKNPAWLAGQYWVSSFRAVDDYEYIGLFGSTKHTMRVDEDWRYRGVWEMGSVAKNDVHPATFPVELPARLIQLLTDRNARVVDPFIGSGTTMVAAEQNGRLGHGIEKSHVYAAVTLERMADMGLSPAITEEGWG